MKRIALGRSVVVAAVVGLCGLTSSADASLSFSLDTTGAQLLADNPLSPTNSVFPSRTPTVPTSSTSIEFPAGSASFDEIVVIEVLSASVDNAGKDFDFFASIDMTRLGSTTTPIFALTDRNNYIGGQVRNSTSNSLSGFGALREGDMLSDLGGSTGTDFSANTTFPGINTSFPVDLTVSNDGGESSATFGFDTTTGPLSTTTSSTAFDLAPELGLFFVIALESSSDLFQLDNLELTLIPEPGVASLLLASGLVLLRRRRAA